MRVDTLSWTDVDATVTREFGNDYGEALVGCQNTTAIELTPVRLAV